MLSAWRSLAELPGIIDARVNFTQRRRNDEIDAARIAEAVKRIKALRERGFDLMVLSGDRPAAVAPVAQELGI